MLCVPTSLLCNSNIDTVMHNILLGKVPKTSRGGGLCQSPGLRPQNGDPPHFLATPISPPHFRHPRCRPPKRRFSHPKKSAEIFLFEMGDSEVSANETSESDEIDLNTKENLLSDSEIDDTDNKEELFPSSSVSLVISQLKRKLD